MRVMLASPENRARIYRAIKANLSDTGTAIGTDTLARRAGLDPMVVEACCEAMLDTQCVVKQQNHRGDPLWTVVVK